VTLNPDKGYFITDNASMRKFVTSAIKISLNGVSLTVISFTIVFLFHGVGGKYMTATNVKGQIIMCSTKISLLNENISFK